VDVRLVGATNEDLPMLVARGRFRADLLDRLSFEVVTLPPLRERAEDIEVLASHFARRMAAELGWSRFPGFTDKATALLDSYPWPGNVRELKNVVERSLYRWGDADKPIGRIILDPFESPWRPAALPGAGHAASATPAPINQAAQACAPAAQACAPAAQACAPTAPAHATTSDFRLAVLAYERDILVAALDRCRHNQRRTAAALALSYDQLRHALKRHDLLE